MFATYLFYISDIRLLLYYLTNLLVFLTLSWGRAIATEDQDSEKQMHLSFS